MTANYIGREIGYPVPGGIPGGWGTADRAINEYFRPIDTFGERFDKLLGQIRGLGFDTLDLYTAHLHWSWATDEHITLAQDLLRRHQLSVASLAGGFGVTPEQLEAACRIANAMGTTILGGNTSLLETDREHLVATLKNYGVQLAVENHPAEKTPEDMLAKIGDGGDGTIGTAVDTGWYGTNGYDAARAIERLGDAVLYVHLKDVLAAGAHDTCRYGEGVVPIQECIQVLQRNGYRGDYSVEHEPGDVDPSEDCRAMLATLRGWLNQDSNEGV